MKPVSPLGARHSGRGVLLCRRVDLALELAGPAFSLRAAAAISGVPRPNAA
jgi:hypothetical protein